MRTCNGSAVMRRARHRPSDVIPAKARNPMLPSWLLGPRLRGDERSESVAMHPVSPHAVKAMLADGEELALIDVREELIYSQNHLLWARSVPLSRLELRFARLVPRNDDAHRAVRRRRRPGAARRRYPRARRLLEPVLSRRRRRGLGGRRLRTVLRRQCAEQGVRRIRRARLRDAEHRRRRSSTG